MTFGFSAAPARQRCSDASRTSLGRNDPGVELPRRRVTNVLSVSALQFRDPLLFEVLAKADDTLLIHANPFIPVWASEELRLR